MLKVNRQLFPRRPVHSGEGANRDQDGATRSIWRGIHRQNFVFLRNIRYQNDHITYRGDAIYMILTSLVRRKKLKSFETVLEFVITA